MRKRVVLGLVVALLCLGSSKEAITKADPDPPGEIVSLLNWLNREREEAGLPTLRLDIKLSDIAAAHAREMRELQYYGHYSPVTGSPGNRLRRGGVEFAKMCENISAGYDVSHAFRRLLGSEPHRACLLDAAYEHVGMAVAEAGRFVYLVQVLITSPQAKEPALGENEDHPAGAATASSG